MGVVEKRSSLWFQFLSLIFLCDNTPDLGVRMYMTGEKAYDAQRHADCIWDLWVGAKNKIQLPDSHLPKGIIADGKPVIQHALVTFAERFEFFEKSVISRGRYSTKANAALEECLKEQVSSNEAMNAKTLTKFIETRWTSVGEMLSRMCKLHAALRTVPIIFPDFGLNTAVVAVLEDNRPPS
ncbi:hypothetical protein LOD99_7388 [Oopsacas minuta]|uniref:Uncharacterized protein n=1 Tax=Oopsacas minuta TaxID=111878 RepID=A0AAV7JV76_9METZ|nr:hypothetical protein LOD99_7388 [Oopsacas minuta]